MKGMIVLTEEKGCVKCDHTEIEKGILSATGSGLSKMFDIQHNHFVTIICTKCGYTEFYKQSKNRKSDFIDLFFGG
ncbi:zinc ribbon domain-containing protein [Staphylococcus saccharolyticus]|uniref:zinc ribbon domain-containing protein n=2 Tax=Staphylococcus saccharolyticus TaxID=33028 RepID=UPI003B75C200